MWPSHPFNMILIFTEGTQITDSEKVCVLSNTRKVDYLKVERLRGIEMDLQALEEKQEEEEE